jgi:hypothetical protein
MAARLFCAFKNASSRLQDYYRKFSETTVPRSFSCEEARLPYPTTFTHLSSGVQKKFKLTEQPTPGKLVFLGSIEGSPPDGSPGLLIKFVRTYGLVLHQHCANLGHAPRLLGFEKLPGGWNMVVMEFLDDHIPFSTFEEPSSISSQLRQMFMALVQSFQRKNLVHGDLRAANILVRKDGPGKLSMMLVGFDWGGAEGEVRYPLAINCVGVRRPKGVVDGALITTKHDLEMARDVFLNLP